MEVYCSGKALIKSDIYGILIEVDSELEEGESYKSTINIRNLIETLVNQEDSFCVKSTKYMYSCFTKKQSYFVLDKNHYDPYLP